MVCVVCMIGKIGMVCMVTMMGMECFLCKVGMVCMACMFGIVCMVGVVIMLRMYGMGDSASYVCMDPQRRATPSPPNPWGGWRDGGRDHIYNIDT